MSGLLLDERHDFGRLVTDHRQQWAEVHTRDAMEAVHGVHGQRLTDAPLQGSGAQPLQLVRHGGVELEWHAQRRGEGGEVAPGLPDRRGRVAHPCQPQRGWATRPRRERLEECRPLVALEDVKVNDVDAVLAVEGLENGLVSGEVGKLDVRARLVEDLVDLQGVRRWREGVGGTGTRTAWGDGGDGRGGGGGEPSGESVGEVGGDALHGVAEWGGDAAEEVKVSERSGLVALGHEVGARQKQVHQLKTAVLLLHGHD